jgi:predicted small lipoprotein YifL
MKTVIVMVMAALAASQLTACGADKTDSADSATAAE